MTARWGTYPSTGPSADASATVRPGRAVRLAAQPAAEQAASYGIWSNVVPV